MKNRAVLIASIIVLFLAACQDKAPTTEQPLITAVPTRLPTAIHLPTYSPAETDPILIETLEILPTPTPSATVVPGSGIGEEISTLLDVEDATIRIIAQGEFLESDLGSNQIPHGHGSGFIVDPSGIAITTNNVVAGAEELRVWVGKDTSVSYDAQIVAVSECNNLAVIDIEGSGFDYLGWSQDPIGEGHVAYVAGFTQDAAEFTLVKGRIIDEQASGDTKLASVPFQYTYDSPVEIGHSGGPILNGEGKVTGVHHYQCAEDGSSCGLPGDIAYKTVESILAGHQQDGIGLNGQAIIIENPEVSGIWVSSVQTESPTSNAGLRAGDVLTKLGGQELALDGTLSDYCRLINSLPADESVDIQVVRQVSTEVFEVLEGRLNLDQLGLVSTLTAESATIPRDVPGLNLDASQSGDIYYVTEFFDTDYSGLDWDFFLTTGDQEGINFDIGEGALDVIISKEQTYAYFIFKPLELSDVVLEVKSSNLAAYTNNVSLICRFTDYGWYEFNFSSNGLYWIYRYDPLMGGYQKLAEGGSFEINMGQKTNIFSARCVGNELTSIANGVELKTVFDDVLTDGNVGVSVSSYEFYPIEVEIDYFKVLVP